MKQNEKSRRMFLRDACCGTLGLAGRLGLAVNPRRGRQENEPHPGRGVGKAEERERRFPRRQGDGFVSGHIRRMEIARSQIPFAVMLGCSDSRVSPELLFNTGLGELFIVRNAGNTIDTVALGSIQYGVLVLGAPLIVVLGHQRCGAVEAALSVVQKNATFPGSIGQMIEPIIPAALKASSTGGFKGDALLDAAVRENVRRSVDRLRNSEPSLIQPLRAGKLKIVGARYDLDDGRVDFFVE